MPELLNDQPHRPPKQSHAEGHTEQTEATSGSHCFRAGRLQSREEHHRADLQPENPLWEISPAPARLLPCLCRLQEGLQQGKACSFVGNHEEVQHQCLPCLSHQTLLWQCHQCSPLQWQHRRLFLNNSWSPTGMSTPTHPLQYISGKNHGRQLRRSRRHCKHLRQNSHQSRLCWWHQWLSRRGIIIIIINPLTWGSLGHHRWSCNQFSPFFSVLLCPLGLTELQARPFPDVVIPPLPLSALSSSPFHCALQDGFGQTWWTGNMTIPLQFASLYHRQEVFVWSNCLLALGTDLLVGKMVFVWDV